MSIELTMLALSVALLFVLVIIQAAAGTQAQGLMNMAKRPGARIASGRC